MCVILFGFRLCRHPRLMPSVLYLSRLILQHLPREAAEECYARDTARAGHIHSGQGEAHVCMSLDISHFVLFLLCFRLRFDARFSLTFVVQTIRCCPSGCTTDSTWNSCPGTSTTPSCIGT
jgi:hypothetical protein